MAQAYGIVAEMKVALGKRDEVIAALLAGTQNMPGNLAYMVAEDLENADSIWITEVWESKDMHAASLELPAVQQAIGQARPHIAGFGSRAQTRPVGGLADA